MWTLSVFTILFVWENILKPPKIKPCPSCGSTEIICIMRGETWLTECCENIPEACGFEGPFGMTEAEAIEKWNALSREGKK